MTQREEHRSLYLSYLECCNEHDFGRMASFYTSTIKVNDVPMDPAAVAAQFATLFSAFPDWHWEMRNLVVDGDYIAVHFDRRPEPLAVLARHRQAGAGAFNNEIALKLSDGATGPGVHLRPSREQVCRQHERF